MHALTHIRLSEFRIFLLINYENKNIVLTLLLLYHIGKQLSRSAEYTRILHAFIVCTRKRISGPTGNQIIDYTGGGWGGGGVQCQFMGNEISGLLISW